MGIDLPEDMPDELKELIRKIEEKGVLMEGKGGSIIGGIKLKTPDYSKWVQVGVLTPAEKLLRVRSLRRGREILLEDWTLYTKHQRLRAEVDEIQAVLWHKIETGHSLPAANYHLLEDGRIVMEPGSAGQARKERDL